MTPCRCGSYPFPHRQGGGKCDKPTAKLQAKWAASKAQYHKEVEELIESWHVERQYEAELERQCL